MSRKRFINTGEWVVRSTVCWCSVDRAAAQALASTHPASIDVIGLGCGDGREEVRLTRHLAQGDRDLRLYLLDISQPCWAPPIATPPTP